MQDGTYLVKSDGSIVNYGDRWAYGYFVGNGWSGINRDPSTITDWAGLLQLVTLKSGSKLVGVWTDTRTGRVYIDPVTHVSDRESAIELGLARAEMAIWDARDNVEIIL